MPQRDSEISFVKPMLPDGGYYDENAWVGDLRGVLSVSTVAVGFLIVFSYFRRPEILIWCFATLLGIALLVAFGLTPLLVRAYRRRHPRNRLRPLRLLRRERNFGMLLAAVAFFLIASLGALAFLLRPLYFPWLDPELAASILRPLLAAPALAFCFIYYLYARCILPNFGSENHVVETVRRPESVRIEIDGMWDEYRDL